MRIFVSFLAFTLVMVVGVQSLASEGGTEKNHRDNSALFPQPQPNKALSTPPQPTSLIEPAFMAKISTAETTLKWKPVDGVTHYHLQLATDPTFKWLKVDEKLFQGTTFQAKDLQPGQQYFWRVAPVKPENMAGSIKGEYVKSTFETTATK